jgi:hypothetical protein
MDFINGLPRTPSGNNSIWVFVDRLTKVAHFIPVCTIYCGDKLARLYTDNILKLDGVPRSIVSDRGAQFVSKFASSAQDQPRLYFSIPHTDRWANRASESSAGRYAESLCSSV